MSLSLYVRTAERSLALSEVLFIVCNQLLDSNPLTRVQSLNASSHADTHISCNCHSILHTIYNAYRFCGDQIVLTWALQCPHEESGLINPLCVWSSSVSSGFRLLTLLIRDVLRQISWERLTQWHLTNSHTLEDNTHTFTNCLSYTALSAFFFSFERNYYLYPARMH